MDGIRRYPREFVPSHLSAEPGGGQLMSWKELIGDEPRWSWGAVQVFRALAAPVGDVSLPANPYSPELRQDPHDLEFLFRETTYWSALHALTTLRLGWANPGNGVLSLTDSDYPSDPMIEMILSIWYEDGTLDEFINWKGSRRVTDGQLAREDSSEIEGKHLELHVVDAWMHPYQRPVARLLGVDADSRSATATFETAHGWYGELDKLGSTLPDLGGRSWYVDVYVKPIGFMGTFRKSRVTGRWFVGRHAIHMIGNVEIAA